MVFSAFGYFVCPNGFKPPWNVSLPVLGSVMRRQLFSNSSASYVNWEKSSAIIQERIRMIKTTAEMEEVRDLLGKFGVYIQKTHLVRTVSK